MVTTVLGDISSKDLGVTSVHEHMLIDMRHCVVQTGNEPPLFFEKFDASNRRFAYDFKRIYIMKQLVNDGFLSQLLVSNDICLKSMLEAYGGNGYTHILKTIRYMAEQNGIVNQYDSMLTDNVKRFFHKQT